MPGGRLTFSALCGALLFPSLVLSQSVARADLYHAVAVGETLSSVALKYRVSTDQLRVANGLSDGDTAPLGAMLLRVPGIEGKAQPSSPSSSAGVPGTGFGNSLLTAAGGAQAGGATATGTIGRAMLDVVMAGDSWESIAQRYRASGHDVSAEALRRRNGWGSAPVAGSNIVVPLGQVTYSAPIANPFAPRIATGTNSSPSSIVTAAQIAVPSGSSGSSRRAAPTRSAPAPRPLAGGAVASEEVDLPFAKDLTPTQPPVFGASVSTSMPRRPAPLASRGGFGQQARNAMGGQVRVLSPEEEAAAPPASRARVATNTAAARANSLARVAIVTGSGARIRRLPQDSAVTLYKCAPGIQLAVLKQSGPWAAVLMSDKSTGWLPTKYLKITSETRDISFQITSGDPGGTVGGYAGNYAGENPMVAQALRWLGTPYRYGGTSRRGIDCSALVQTAFRACGYGLPRTAAQQARVGTPVAPAQLRAGDRLYFSASGSRVDHTGLYMGDGLFVHASGSGRQVMVSNLFTPRNWNIFVGARR